MIKKRLFVPLNLQFFAEGEGEETNQQPQETVYRGGYNPDEEIEFNADATNPLAEEEPEETEETNPSEGQLSPEETGESSVSEQQDQQIDFGGRKVDPSDINSILGAQQDFQNAQRFITQQSQENQMLRQQLQQLQQGQPQQGQQAPQQPQGQPQEQQQEQERDLSADELQDLFYDDPAKYHQELQKQITRQVEQKYEPVRQQQEQMQRQAAFQQEFNNVAQKYGDDFDRNFDGIKQLANELGDDQAEKIGLENLYLMAKGRNNQAPSPDQLAQDPQFIENHILNNEEVRQRIMNEHMQNKSQNRPPRTMNNKQGGTANLSKAQRPKTISEAGKLARQHFDM